MEEFLKQLEADDIEGGLLSDLEVEVPSELHKVIMNKINSQSIRKRRFDFKRFSSFAAAILIFLAAISVIYTRIGVGYKKMAKKPEMASITDNRAIKQETQDLNKINNEAYYDDAKQTTDSSGEVITLVTKDLELIAFLKTRGIELSKEIYKIDFKDFVELRDRFEDKATIYSDNNRQNSSSALKESQNSYIIIKLVEE